MAGTMRMTVQIAISMLTILRASDMDTYMQTPTGRENGETDRLSNVDSSSLTCGQEEEPGIETINPNQSNQSRHNYVFSAIKKK